MFLSEWREFPLAPCFAGKEIWWQLAFRFCWNRARPLHATKLVSFLVGLRTYQHPRIRRCIHCSRHTCYASTSHLEPASASLIKWASCHKTYSAGWIRPTEILPAKCTRINRRLQLKTDITSYFRDLFISVLSIQ